MTAWKPAVVRFIRAKFESACFWCGFAIPTGAPVAFYPNEREAAHESCHREACT
jgi:hypothetical protein